jgi:hypothetical protein
MLTTMQLLTTIVVSTLLTVVFTVCLISALETDVSKIAKKSNDKSSTIRVIIPLKPSDSSKRQFALKKERALDRIDVYNQYDDESIEIDEDPVSFTFSLRNCEKNLRDIIYC